MKTRGWGGKPRPPPPKSEQILTRQQPVKQLSEGLLLQPPERRVGDPLHDTLVKYAAHHLLLGGVEFADIDIVAPGVLFRGAEGGRGGGRGARQRGPHLGGRNNDRVFFGARD